MLSSRPLAPQNVQELRSFLGLQNYYGKFIPNLASLIQPLNSLLQHDHKLKWSASSRVLVHYDPSLPITLAGGASAYGIGAVISHCMTDGSEPCACACVSVCACV